MTVEQEEFRCGFVAIVGRPNVGKSTLLNQLIEQKISITSKKAQTTRHRIHGIYTDEQSQFIFVDTPGFQTQYNNALNRGMNKVVTSSLRDVQAVIFVVEAMRFTAADRQVLELLPDNRPVILVINKIDTLAQKRDLFVFADQIRQEFEFVAMLPVSARQGVQVTELRQELRQHMPSGDLIYDEDDITDRSERFLAAELLREKIFRFTGDELPYSTSVIIERFETAGPLRRIYAAVLVDREAHKSMLIGKKGSKLKEISTQARQDMEKLFDGKVYLEVFVKQRSGWADNPAMLRSLGYE